MGWNCPYMYHSKVKSYRGLTQRKVQGREDLRTPTPKMVRTWPQAKQGLQLLGAGRREQTLPLELPGSCQPRSSTLWHPLQSSSHRWVAGKDKCALFEAVKYVVMNTMSKV